MQWETKYRLGIPAIDAQHRQIFSFLNELVLAMRQGCSARDVEELLTRIEQYTVRHFGLEEKYMNESKYPGLETQRQAHGYFAHRLAEITAEFRQRGLSSTVVNSLRNELTEWIKRHVTGLDQDFGNYYRQHLKRPSVSPAEEN